MGSLGARPLTLPRWPSKLPRMSVGTCRGGRNVLTPHPVEAYPGLPVLPGPEGQVRVIVPRVGETIVAVGGERLHGFETVDGGLAGGFDLGPGDRATIVREGLAHSLVEWRIERA